MVIYCFRVLFFLFGFSYCSVPLALIYFYLSFGQLNDTFGPLYNFNKGSKRGYWLERCLRIGNAKHTTCPLGTNNFNMSSSLLFYTVFFVYAWFCIRSLFDSAKATLYVPWVDYIKCPIHGDVFIRQLSKSPGSFVAFFFHFKMSWMP